MVVLSRRALLIANPASRRGGALVDDAMRAVEAAGVSCELLLTTHPGHAAELATAHAHSYDLVLALGGDGTAMEVAGALAGSGIPIGVIPGGTGNLLAGALGIPRSVRAAVPALLHGDLRKIDLGVVHGRRFAVAAGVGIDATMVEQTPRWLKRHLGVLAYALIGSKAAITAVLMRRFFTARLEVDGEVIERRAAAVLFANFGAILDEWITFGPGIQVDDGAIDCCIFSPRNLWDSVRIMWRVMRQDFRPDPSILYKKGTSFRLTTVPPLSVQADGELVGTTPVSISVEPLAASMLVPRRPTAPAPHAPPR